ncbi:hypothetical protein [Pelosinus sp. sgz500959]
MDNLFATADVPFIILTNIVVLHVIGDVVQYYFSPEEDNITILTE